MVWTIMQLMTKSDSNKSCMIVFLDAFTDGHV